ncbi:hypothetical protein [Marispirochaeta aestuarii]|uniref:hypothetical protein n=1 Tax=Marispirochaeta aestuarii TaxID=1963862 RepID=UPI002ABD705A|nr:hypothetical protein [Marispirochaeta aestuarii]
MIYSLRKGLSTYTEGPGFSMPPYEHGHVFRTVSTHPEPEMVHGHISWIGKQKQQKPPKPQKGVKSPGGFREKMRKLVVGPRKEGPEQRKEKKGEEKNDWDARGTIKKNLSPGNRRPCFICFSSVYPGGPEFL